MSSATLRKSWGPLVRRCPGTSCSDQEKKYLDFRWTSSRPGRGFEGRLDAFAEHLAGRSRLVTVPAALEEDNGQEVETGSMMQILLVNFGIEKFAFSERVRPCDRCDGEPAFPGRRCGLSASVVFPDFCSGMASNCSRRTGPQRKPSQLPRQSRHLHALLQRGLLRRG